MKLKALKKIFQNELNGLYEIEEINNFFFMLIENYLNVKRIHLALNPEMLCPTEKQQYLQKALKRLKQEIPIQYILGETEFFGFPFKVNSNVLIPRHETEELVDWILNHQQNSNIHEPRILDIGTGSGCIAISLAKKLPKAKVYALDISPEAINLAKQNAESNNVYIDFFVADILNTDTFNEVLKNLEFDIIVSNPPYVRELEKKEMKANVLKNEPHLALFVHNENPLLFYKAITTCAINNLIDNGCLFFEINEYLGNQMIKLLEVNNFSNIELKQDIFKKDRMIKAVK